MLKNKLHLMTWKEIEEAFKKDPVVIIPLGSMEQHGPHSITGDFLASTEIVTRVAEKTGALFTPTVPFGHSEYFRSFPGTISLSSETLLSLLMDMCESLTEHGITRILFFNGHAGNATTIDKLARKIRREKGFMVASIDLWQSLSKSFKQELYGDDFDPSGHGGEPLTSVMKYLYPEDMRMDLLYDNPKDTEKLSILGMSKVGIEDAKVSVYYNFDDITENGVTGNPLASSKERGEAIINKLVEQGIAFVENFKQIQTTTHKGK